MPSYGNDGRVVARRSGVGRMLALLIGLLLVIVAVLFFTGFWRADVTKEGSLPQVDVSARGGELPQVDLDSKRIVVGETNASIEVPKVSTEKEKIAVPTVGVAEGKKD